MMDSYKTAFEDWRKLLAGTRVLEQNEAARRFGVSTSPHQCRIAGALCPETTAEVAEIVKIAQSHRIPLYAISTGRNWGYGTAVPPGDDCVIVDLSGMNKIIACDPQLGTVTLQPGVTQEMLRHYLDEQKLPFLVPVHGGGPRCSLIGNALERGYGITPEADHFAAVLSLEAVLPSGQVYRSPLQELGAPDVARVFKWGVGPYLDGLFTQSNLGIVTEMTIGLAHRPECIEAFYFWIPEDEGLENAVEAVHEIRRTLGSAVGAINLVDRRRGISMTVPYPFDRIAAGAIMTEDLVGEIGRRSDFPAWMGVGTVYGDRRIVKAVRAVVKEKLKNVSSRVIFLTPTVAQRLWAIASRLPFVRDMRRVRILPKLIEGLKLACGIPSEIALQLTTWKNAQVPRDHNQIDPPTDGTGLIWYTPLIPMRAPSVRVYVDLLRSVCEEYRIEPLITLTSVSERCFDSSVPLLFDKTNPDESERAEKCYRALYEKGRSIGFIPYRMGTDHMDLLYESPTPFWDTVRKIKSALDPLNILSPGRYAPRSQETSAPASLERME